MKKAYIKYSSAISPQASISEEFPWNEVHVYENKLNCIEPVYKEYFPPMQIRRMSRLVKMALTTAKICLDKSGVDMPDAIITASGWGCLNDTYKYLDEITDEKTIAPSPATFIQSTHNTPGGQIALTLACQNYNNVIVNGNTSFEYALIDTLMLINESKENILVGGFDEIAEADYKLKLDAGYWKKPDINSSEFIHHHSEGTLPGEGASFFVVGSENSGSHSYINSCSIVTCPPNTEDLKLKLSALLNDSNLSFADIDVVLSGNNGDSRNAALYKKISSDLFPISSIIHYKSLCGEYDTSSAFALWLADKLIQNKSIPANLAENSTINTITHILIYNYAGENKHAITLVSKTNI
jgi:3-oxoacyl-[acyl-carrier-protein] synthase II